MNNREFPNKQFFFRILLMFGREKRYYSLQLWAYPPASMWHFFPLHSLFAIDGEREKRKLYCYLYFPSFPIIWKPISTPVKGGGGKERERVVNIFRSTQYLYSATTNKLPRHGRRERNIELFWIERDSCYYLVFWFWVRRGRGSELASFAFGVELSSVDGSSRESKVWEARKTFFFIYWGRAVRSGKREKSCWCFCYFSSARSDIFCVHSQSYTHIFCLATHSLTPLFLRCSKYSTSQIRSFSPFRWIGRGRG